MYIYIYIYIYILVTRCDGSRREVRSTPHQAFTFENTTAAFIELHMFRHCLVNIVFKQQFTTTCKFALENNKHKKLKTTKTHVEKTCAKLACGPNNFKNTKPMEIETCSPLHKILIRLWKFNIDRTNHHICWSQPPPKSVVRGSTMFQCLTL